MFNFIMISTDWSGKRAELEVARILESTEPELVEKFRGDGELRLDLLSKLPCLFLNEGTGDQEAHVGRIFSSQLSGGKVFLEVDFDQEVPSIQNRFLKNHESELRAHGYLGFHRNHWAVKDVDLYRFLLRHVRPRRQHPKVFKLPEHESIREDLLSVMMPFHPSFDDVYNAIKAAGDECGLLCRKADNIWEAPEVITDVVNLIDKARIVVCDLTGKNPNVFYETGIAHTLGRDAILITQNNEDVPFDVKHLRYLQYENNEAGRQILQHKLFKKFSDIIGT